MKIKFSRVLTTYNIIYRYDLYSNRYIDDIQLKIKKFVKEEREIVMLEIIEEVYTIDRNGDELIDLIIIVDEDETIQKPTEEWQGMQ